MDIASIRRLVEENLPFIAEKAVTFGRWYTDFEAKLKTTLNGIPVEDAIKMAWNFTEQSRECYGFEDLLSFVKKSYNLEEGSVSALFVLKRTTKNGMIDLHICAKSSVDDTPVLDGSQPYCVVHTAKLDASLDDQFAGKSLIVLR